MAAALRDAVLFAVLEDLPLGASQPQGRHIEALAAMAVHDFAANLASELVNGRARRNNLSAGRADGHTTRIGSRVNLMDERNSPADPYDSLELLDSSRGGLRFRATARPGIHGESERPVELWYPWTEDPERWQAWRRRVGLAQLVESPAARRVLHADWNAVRPRVTLDVCDGTTLREWVAEKGGVNFFELAQVLRDLADALAAAHRVGLAHGHLSPDSVRVTASSPTAAPLHGRLDFHFLPLDVDPAAVEPPDDIAQLGRLWIELLGGRDSLQTSAPAGFPVLVDRMCAADRYERPVAPVVLAALRNWIESGPRVDLERTQVVSSVDLASREWSPERAHETQAHAPAPLSSEWSLPKNSPRTSDPLESRQTLGRFHLIEKLGEGGMGSVWKAEDPLDGGLVAIKALRADLAQDQLLLRRFHREARLLAEVDHPRVARLREINADGELHYLVLEFVPGSNLANYLKERGKLEERVGVAMAADVARALADAHERGIVHRDLKPENILVCAELESTAPQVAPHDSRKLSAPRVKLTDFGLARHVDETQSQHLTSAGALLGTPLYIAPEQCAGRVDVDARADVYSLGATLFHLLAGRPPFDAANLVGLLTKHLQEPAPKLRSIVPELSDAVEAVVAKCLEKRPDDRYANARELLADLERIARGSPTSFVAHPRLPETDSADALTFDFTWDLRNAPERLWPYISNTERLNRAIGLSAVEYATEADPRGGSRRSGQFRKLGMTIAWREHPYEWIEGRRMGVLREFTQGPWKWFTSVVELEPRADGGTSLLHRIRIRPTSFIGRTAAKIEIGLRARQGLDRVYRHIDAALAGELGDTADPFEDPSPLSGAQSRAFDERLERLLERGVDPQVVDRLGEFLAEAPQPEVARIRPFALAARLNVPERSMLEACLWGAREGLLTLLWDILCPVCRVASQVQETLKAIREHGSCSACQTDFPLDFANSIELVFRVANELRAADTGTYCIGGPVHSPHVAAQVRLAAGEQFDLGLALREGEYRLRGPQLPYAIDFRVAPRGVAAGWSLPLSQGAAADLPRLLRIGSQRLTLINDTDQEVVARIERTAARSDACTAARAAATPLFRELFPGECLAPERLVQIEQITMLVTRLEAVESFYEQLGDSAAFARLHDHFRRLDQAVRHAGGSLVKTVADGIYAVFTEPVAAVRAAAAMLTETEPELRVAIHRGPALVATLNDHLDYFGSTVHRAQRLLVQPGRAPRAADLRLVVTPAVVRDPQVAEFLASERTLAGVWRIDS